MNIGKFKLIKKIKEKKKKGFTLVELLAVIVILAVIMVITIPTIIGSMSKAKEKSEEIFIASIERSLNKFIENELVFGEYLFNENKQEYTTRDIDGKYRIVEVVKTDNSSITFDDFDLLGYYPKNDLINPKTDEKCTNNELHIYKDKTKNDIYYYSVELDCLDSGFSNLPPEEPDLSTGLVPVVYKTKDGTTGWYTVDPSSNWYDYNSQEWANAVVINPSYYDRFYDANNNLIYDKEIGIYEMYAMFVWIPRFSYTIGCHEENKCFGYRLNDGTDPDQLSKELPGAIDIKFIPAVVTDKLKDGVIKPSYNYNISGSRVPTNWYTPEAFWWNVNNNEEREKIEELPGIWVGKFETSQTAGYLKILPNENGGIGGTDLSNYFKLSKMFGNINNSYTTGTYNFYEKYKLKGDSHIAKNSDWSAVAYLSQSIYGKYGNDKYSGKNKEIFVNCGWDNTTGKSCGNTTSSSTKPTSTQIKSYNISDSGTGASTTGNITGIYDMNGGSFEYVMGNYGNSLGENSGFTEMPERKYYDNISFTDIIGQSLRETCGWYKDECSLNGPWFRRGGQVSGGTSNGIFYIWGGSGGPVSGQTFRVALTKLN